LGGGGKWSSRHASCRESSKDDFSDLSSKWDFTHDEEVVIDDPELRVQIRIVFPKKYFFYENCTGWTPFFGRGFVYKLSGKFKTKLLRVILKLRDVEIG